MIRETERPMVIGNPRRRRAGPLRWGWPGGCRPALAVPTARGTPRPRTIQTTRTAHEGTHDGTGMKARRNVATFGKAIPSRSSGPAAAAATTPDRKIFHVPLAYPKMATTAQSNSALKILPNERPMKAISAWTIAMLVQQSKGHARVQLSPPLGGPPPVAPRFTASQLPPRETLRPDNR